MSIFYSNLEILNQNIGINYSCILFVPSHVSKKIKFLDKSSKNMDIIMRSFSDRREILVTG